MELYINNLAAGTMAEQLQELFETFGEVTEVRVNKNSFTKTKKGNAFLKMTNSAQAREAVDALNGKPFNGRKIIVSIALPRV